MKALSVKQPFAVELAYWGKHIEFRSRPTAHRGSLLICSSKSQKAWLNGDSPIALPLGAMLGVRELVDCRPMIEADLEEFGAPGKIDGWYAWVFDKDAGDTVKPITVNGSISFFNVDDALIESLGDGQSFLDCDYQNKANKPPKDLDFEGNKFYIE